MGIEGMSEARSVFRQAMRKLSARWWWRACVLLVPTFSAAVVTRLGPELLLPIGAASASLGLVLLGCALAEIRTSNALHAQEIEESRSLRVAVISGAAQVDLLLEDVALIAQQARKDAEDAAARVLVLGQSLRRSLHAEADEIRRLHARSAAEARCEPAHLPYIPEGEPQDAGPDAPTVVRVVPEVPASTRNPRQCFT